ncbi:hypothetical protein HDU97_002973 [Phlyctochytrium planicorne]|nr:hypothetical protein HDU97_002973 [Phlyctochytrium planicorne]
MGGGRFVAWLLHDLGEAYNLKILVPDRPGMGLSDPWDLDAFPDVYVHSSGLQMEASSTCWRGGFKDWADVVVQIADALKIEKFGQMGMSCGCLYALAVAAKYPERLLPCPIQMFSPWIPPSLPGSNVYTRAAYMVPTSVFVNILSSMLRLSSDPSKVEVVDNIMGTVRWVTDMFTAPFMWNRKNGGADATNAEEGDEDDEDDEDTDPISTDGGLSRIDSLSTLSSPSLFNRTIHRVISKLEAIAYTMMNHPGMSPQEAEKRAIELSLPISVRQQSITNTSTAKFDPHIITIRILRWLNGKATIDTHLTSTEKQSHA